MFGTDEANLGEIGHIVADDVVDVGSHHFCGENITHRVHVAPQEEFFPESIIIHRGVFVQVDDVAIIEKLRKGGQGFANQTR